jgi:hypothetical protein
MVGRAKTVRQKKIEDAEFKEIWMQRAIEIYKQEHQLSNPLSLEKICHKVQDECYQKKGKVVKISSSTLDRRAKGGHNHNEAHSAQRWLTDEETELVIQDVIMNADHGFPPTHH